MFIYSSGFRFDSSKILSKNRHKGQDFEYDNHLVPQNFLTDIRQCSMIKTKIGRDDPKWKFSKFW